MEDKFKGKVVTIHAKHEKDAFFGSLEWIGRIADLAPKNTEIVFVSVQDLSAVNKAFYGKVSFRTPEDNARHSQLWSRYLNMPFEIRACAGVKENFAIAITGEPEVVVPWKTCSKCSTLFLYSENCHLCGSPPK